MSTLAADPAVDSPGPSPTPAPRPVLPYRPGRRHLWIVLAITVLGFVLRFMYPEKPLLWGDDAYTIYRTHADYKSMLDILQYDGFTPLHYQLYWVLGRIKTEDHPAGVGGPVVKLSTAFTPAVVRFLPALWGSLMAPAMYFLAVQLVRRRTALVAALIAACSAYLLGYSRDGKMYMMLWSFTTLSTACLLWWLRAGTRLAWLAWVASSLAMCSAHMTGPAMLPFQAIFFITRSKVEWKNSILFVLGLVVILAGPFAYMNQFNRWSQEENQDFGFDVEGLGWVKPYNIGRTGTDLVNYATSAYLFSWEWPKPISQPMIKPWVLNSLKTSAIVLLVLAAIGMMPWSRRLRGINDADPADQPPQPWWRTLLWLSLWLVIPTYFVYCRSMVDYVSPKAWHEWLGANLGGSAWREELKVVPPAKQTMPLVPGTPAGIDLKNAKLADVIDLKHAINARLVNVSAPASDSSKSPSTLRSDYGTFNLMAARGAWEPGYRTNHWFWVWLLIAVTVAGTFICIFARVRRGILWAAPAMAAAALFAALMRVGAPAGDLNRFGDWVSHLWPALQNWADMLSQPSVLTALAVIVPGLIFFYCAASWRDRVLRTVVFLIVAGVVYGACWGSCAMTTGKFQKEFTEQAMKLARPLKKSSESDEQFLQRPQDLTTLVASTKRALAEGQWHSIFMPRYFGFAWIAFCIAIAALYMRLPTLPLRIAAVCLIVAVNLAQFGGRLFAGTEPPLDRVAHDVWLYDSHNPKRDDTGRAFVNDSTPSDPVLGGAGHPACGRLEGQQGKYCLGLERGYWIHPVEWKRVSAARYFDFYVPGAGRGRGGLDYSAIINELKNSPKVNKTVLWEKIVLDPKAPPRFDKTTGKTIPPWTDKANEIVATMERAGWKKKTDVEAFVVRFHWEWKELYTYLRLEFTK